MELTTLIHKIHHENGAIVMPLKMAVIYKCDTLKTIINFNKKIYVSVYRNLDDSLHDYLTLFKKTLDTII